MRSGSACTVLATSVMVQASVKAAEESGIDAEIIDMRSLDMTGIDWELSGQSIAKPTRVVISAQVASGLSLVRHWAVDIQRPFFIVLAPEIPHATGRLSVPVVSLVLDKAALGSSEKVRAALEKITRNA